MFTFNGIDSTTYLIENNVKQSILPSLSPRLHSIPRRAGAWDFGTDIGVREFDIDVTIKGSSLSDLRATVRDIANWLYQDGLCTLVFSDEPTKTYYARLSGDTNIEQMVYNGQGTIKFVCPEPFAFGSTHIQNIDHGFQVAPTLVRNTIAYNSDGTTVTTNTIRYTTAGKFGQTVRLEEASTNLLTANMSNVETDLTGLYYATGGTATLVRDTAQHWEGTASAKVTNTTATATDTTVSHTEVALTAATSYVGSAWVRSDSAVTVLPIGIAEDAASTVLGTFYGTAVALTPNTWTRIYLIGTTPANTTKGRIAIKFQALPTNGNGWVDGQMIDAATVLKSFITGGTTRNADVLTVPSAGILNDAKGTYEGWFYDDGTSQSAMVFDTSTSGAVATNRFLLWRFSGDGLYYAYFNGASVMSTPTRPAVGWHKFSVRWNGTAISLWVDNTQVASNTLGSAVTFSGINTIHLGCRYTGVYQPNGGLIDDFRFSSIDRSDLATASLTTAMTVDADTTYKLSFDNTLAVTTDSTPSTTYTYSATYKTYPKFTVTFKQTAANFKIQLGSDYVYVINSFVTGDVLVIDCDKAQVTLNGLNKMNILDVSSKFFPFVVGSNIMTITSAHIATMDVQVTDKYL